MLLADGPGASGFAKTARALMRYRRQDIVAVLDRCQAGKTAEQGFGVGGDIPVIGSLAECPTVDALFIGIAPAGGKLPEAWQPLLLQAIESGIDVVSGLHDFLVNNTAFCHAAERSGARLIDVRRNNQAIVAEHVTFPANNLRIHTVGHDCCVGKMVVAVEVERALKQQGRNAKFLATGQTGIMLAGDGVPVDCVVSDFASGAIEQMVIRNQGCDTLLIEGQGSLAHPSFSGVTASLLHGCAPQGMILCYEAGRQTVYELEHVAIKPLDTLIALYESMAAMRYPAKVIAVAVNGKNLTPEDIDIEVDRIEQQHGLPACDVYRHGAGKLVGAVEELRTALMG